MTSFGKGNFSIRSEHYRFIQYLDGSKELYDSKSDPHEWTNLATDQQFADVVAQHQKHIPVNQHDVLPGKSTGHEAYSAAGQHIAPSSIKRDDR